MEKTDFRKENNFEYEFKEKGNYLVRTYIKKQKNQKKWSIVTNISYDENDKTWKDISPEYPYLNMIYNGQSYEKISNNTYKFKIDYNYSLNSSVKWYIYRNGMYYSVAEIKNNNEFEYTFNEPGNYAVLYYLKTQEKDNEFWNFPLIEIQ
ncbi:MAG: hypothetical protein Q4Q23_07470 [Methanobacteriaceae archaeon]|nr:hypothetical protein [Methanobacteriaceae archaeon]